MKSGKKQSAKEPWIYWKYMERILAEIGENVNNYGTRFEIRIEAA